MTPLKEIIEGLRMKANQHYNPSMDGTRDERMEGRKEAYLDCANILEKWRNSIDENKLDGLAENCGRMSQYMSDYRYDKYSVISSFKSGYRKAMKE